MAYTDAITLGSTSHSYTTTMTPLGSSPGVTYDGVDAYSIDGDFNTHQGVYGAEVNTGEMGNGREGTCLSQHTFAAPQNLKSIVYKMYNYGLCNGLNGTRSQNQRIQYTTDGSNWNDVAGTVESSSWSGTGSSGATLGGSTQTISVDLAGVTGIRAYTYGYVYVAESITTLYLRIYELQAFALDPLLPIFQYYKGGVKTIGCEALKASHKLRAVKNGTIYGIPLVETNDAGASDIRIYDGTSVKSLPLATE